LTATPKVTIDYRQVRDESVTRRLNRPAAKEAPGLVYRLDMTR